jgi:hypothetical protein
MLIALLAVLGVDLIVIVILLAVLLIRRRGVSHQKGAFKGAIRASSRDVPGFKTRWKRGYGRWVSDVLVWTKAPFLFRTELTVGEVVEGEVRRALAGEMRRLGKHPVIVPVAVEGGRLEIAVAENGQEWIRDRSMGDVLSPDRSA